MLLREFIARTFSFSPISCFSTKSGLGAYADSSDEDSDVEDNVRTDDHSDWEPESVLKVKEREESSH